MIDKMLTLIVINHIILIPSSFNKFSFLMIGCSDAVQMLIVVMKILIQHVGFKLYVVDEN